MRSAKPLDIFNETLGHISCHVCGNKTQYFWWASEQFAAKNWAFLTRRWDNFQPSLATDPGEPKLRSEYKESEVVTKRNKVGCLQNCLLPTFILATGFVTVLLVDTSSNKIILRGRLELDLVVEHDLFNPAYWCPLTVAVRLLTLALSTEAIYSWELEGW